MAYFADKDVISPKVRIATSSAIVRLLFTNATAAQARRGTGV